VLSNLFFAQFGVWSKNGWMGIFAKLYVINVYVLVSQEKSFQLGSVIVDC
jgi:hypothetical protein